MELEGECGDFESTAFSAPGSFFSSSKKLLWVITQRSLYSIIDEELRL
jgi:hypothetical protein